LGLKIGIDDESGGECVTPPLGTPPGGTLRVVKFGKEKPPKLGAFSKDLICLLLVQ